MRKMTPMILVVLMLASVFAGIDFVELEETVVIEEAGARTGADAETIAITSPKETSCNNNGCRNELKVGETTNFAAFIKNSGDTAIEEMGYAVTVYLDDGSGNAGLIAKDSQGNDLSWENGDVVCDDVLACPYANLSAGAILAGGKTTLQYGGQDIEWIPAAGNYIVEVVVNAVDDVDPGNDVLQISVSVIDWVDITVDLSWDNNNGNDVITGSGQKDFTLTVVSNGSATGGFNPRNVSILLKVAGDLTSASDGTNDISGTTYLTAGESGHMVETFRHGEDPNNVTNETRTVLLFQQEWTYQGSVVPDTSGEDAAYSIEASLMNYVDYDSFESCWETFTEGENESQTETTYFHMCEEVQNSDDYPTSNSDAITGALNNFHDIRITTLTVFQGYNADGSGDPTFSLSDGQVGDLNVGKSRIHVQVEHRGSDISSLYYWNVTFTTTKDGESVSQTSTVGDCMDGVPPAYQHAQLGEDQSVLPPALPPTLTGFACDIIDLQEGTYTFEASLSMDGKNSDQRPSNNYKSMTLDVVNNLPMITSFDLNTVGDLIVGQEELLQMSVEAFDVDDASGESLEYTWAYQGGALPGCGGVAGAGVICQFPIINDYVMTFAVTVTVTDSEGASVSEEMILEIWNNGVGSATTDSGIGVNYAIEYWAKTDFSITAVDGDLTAFEDQTLPGYTGTYDAIGVVAYAPDWSLTANDVLSQSMTVIFDKSLGATSLWYVTDSGLWQSLSTTAEDVDGTTSMFEVTLAADSSVLPSGSLVLIGAALEEAAVPVASISAFDASAGKGGALVMSWNVSTVLLSSDSEVVTITCDTTGDDCDEADFPFTTNAVAGAKTYTYSGSNTMHGVTYDVSVAICNAQGCSSPIGAGTIVADKAVDGGVSAMNMAVQAVGEEWTVSWAATGETLDVDHWNVCYQKQDSFDAANMPSQCVSTTGATDTTINIAMPTAEGTWDYYFTAVPVDGLGNSAAAASMNSIEYHRDVVVIDDNDGGSIGTGGDSAGVPGWTWGLIGGLLLVAVIVSAGILRRGDDGDEGKDWDY
ncbi:MAG: hypothetical protein P8Q55_04070 [Candidatus Poseidoniaceae archaeon]|nr:hypothetical protein [Candidatus Poseidoniaceae archaeon]